MQQGLRAPLNPGNIILEWIKFRDIYISGGHYGNSCSTNKKSRCCRDKLTFKMAFNCNLINQHTRLVATQVEGSSGCLRTSPGNLVSLILISRRCTKTDLQPASALSLQQSQFHDWCAESACKSGYQVQSTNRRRQTCKEKTSALPSSCDRCWSWGRQSGCSWHQLHRRATAKVQSTLKFLCACIEMPQGLGEGNQTCLKRSECSRFQAWEKGEYPSH